MKGDLKRSGQNIYGLPATGKKNSRKPAVIIGPPARRILYKATAYQYFGLTVSDLTLAAIIKKTELTEIIPRTAPIKI
jgi:hypothetical protein